MGQVAMATDHNGRRTVRTGGAGRIISRRPSRPPEEDARRARANCSLPRMEQGVGDTTKIVVKGMMKKYDDCCALCAFGSTCQQVVLLGTLEISGNGE